MSYLPYPFQPAKAIKWDCYTITWPASEDVRTLLLVEIRLVFLVIRVKFGTAFKIIKQCGFLKIAFW